MNEPRSYCIRAGTFMHSSPLTCVETCLTHTEQLCGPQRHSISLIELNQAHSWLPVLTSEARNFARAVYFYVPTVPQWKSVLRNNVLPEQFVFVVEAHRWMLCRVVWSIALFRRSPLFLFSRQARHRIHLKHRNSMYLPDYRMLHSGTQHCNSDVIVLCE